MEAELHVSGFEIHDSPRQIMSVTVDPDGNLAATTDTLGRVLAY
jgi:YD repeat-containing protein